MKSKENPGYVLVVKLMFVASVYFFMFSDILP